MVIAEASTHYRMPSYMLHRSRRLQDPFPISVTKKGQTMVKKAILGILVCFSAISAGCNMMAGAGKDIERGGNAIENAAERNK
jgi:entericidin B